MNQQERILYRIYGGHLQLDFTNAALGANALVNATVANANRSARMNDDRAMVKYRSLSLPSNTFDVRIAMLTTRCDGCL